MYINEFWDSFGKTVICLCRLLSVLCNTMAISYQYYRAAVICQPCYVMFNIVIFITVTNDKSFTVSALAFRQRRVCFDIGVRYKIIKIDVAQSHPLTEAEGLTKPV